MSNLHEACECGEISGKRRGATAQRWHNGGQCRSMTATSDSALILYYLKSERRTHERTQNNNNNNNNHGALVAEGLERAFAVRKVSGSIPGRGEHKNLRGRRGPSDYFSFRRAVK